MHEHEQTTQEAVVLALGLDKTDEPEACSTPDEQGVVGECAAPVRWRISLPSAPEYWDVCHGHVARALLNVEECYAAGEPVTVRYLATA